MYLTTKQRDVLDGVIYLTQRGEPPTVREIAEILGLSSPSTVQKHLRTLEAVLSMLRRVEDWDGDTALTALRQAGKEVGAKGRSLFMPVRAAITGAVQGPELADVLAIQGRTTTLRVLEESCALLRSSQDTQ